MIEIKDNAKMPGKKERKNAAEEPEGYPIYPESEDIYSKFQKVEDIDPEDLTKIKAPNEPELIEKWNEKDFNDDVSGRDLDIPGSDLDDPQEIIGNEDEENNYYSLGGDAHNDLEEDKGA